MSTETTTIASHFVMFSQVTAASNATTATLGALTTYDAGINAAALVQIVDGTTQPCDDRRVDDALAKNALTAKYDIGQPSAGRADALVDLQVRALRKRNYVGGH